ncbi:hypothetical protein BUALT_Bualt11G0096000 [Buddleja alternifolia]|uniref:Condensation domain-containing protein n=1 Tax=Buddleja alternifolia TaxID=168488 RepID=A0AAV6X2B3_9LAMI|nr:hypothetical protein BUALT_Bualt11G0096000 [Buddleja alternifolia]
MSVSPNSAETKLRPVGATELSWCKAVPGGTGITVLALLLSKPPNTQILQNALHKLQISHPILNSKLHYNPTSNSFSYLTPPTPHIQIHPFDLQSTSQILHQNPISVSPLHLILEHELNRNSWQDPDPSSDADLFFASVYTLEDDKWVVALRLHTSACDRASAVALLSELLGMMGEGGRGGGVEVELGKEVGVSLGIEEYIPSGEGNKPFWARGVDMLGYSLNSLRLSNFSFKDSVSPRESRVVRLKLNEEDTNQILSSCECKEIKLCALLAAAGLIASHTLKGIPDDHWEKYAVATLMDCRSILDPALSSHHMGFYHSAIMNTHDVKGGENLWDLAKRVHSSFENAKNNKKHFSDMADLNFLMCKAIENPSLTPSGSLRTSLISVFEEPMIEHSNNMHQLIGLEDFIGCSSIHGVGPSMAIFDTIRDGKLDCACVYPFPLHSREQMQEFVDEMKRIVLDGTILMG